MSLDQSIQAKIAQRQKEIAQKEAEIQALQ